MNKNLILSLIVILVISISGLVGCSNSKEDDSTKETTNTSTAITVNSDGAIEGDISQELKDELSSATRFFHDYVETSFNVSDLYNQKAIDDLITYQNENCLSGSEKYIINYYDKAKDVSKSSISVSDFGIQSIEKTTEGYSINYFLTLGFDIGGKNSLGTKDEPARALLSLIDGKITIKTLITNK